MEHLQGDVPLGHAVNEGGDGFLVVGGGKGGGQPQAEGVCRGQGGLAGKGGVVGQHLLQILSADEEILQKFPGLGDGHLGHRVGGNLIADPVRAVDEDAVAPGGNVEGDGFVALLAAGAPVRIPDIHGLAVLHKGGELFPEAVDAFSHAQGQLLTDVGAAGIRRLAPEGIVALGVSAVFRPELVFLDVGGGAPCAPGKPLPLVGEGNIPALALADPQYGVPGNQLCIVLFVGDLRGIALVRMQLEFGLVLQGSLKMPDGNPDAILLGGGIGDLQSDAPQGHGTVVDGLGGGQHGDGVLRGGDSISLYCIIHLIAPLVKPESVRKFHRNTPFLRRQTERRSRSLLRTEKPA